MAERILDWTIADNGELSMNKYNADKKAKVENQEIFDLSVIFPMYADFDKVQRHIVVYGSKQQLADCGSAEKTLIGKVEFAVKKWGFWLKGELAGARVNSTGRADDKKAVDRAKTISKVISRDGLIVKKYTFPDSFTEEDQAKLDEFNAMEVAGTQKAPKADKIK